MASLPPARKSAGSLAANKVSQRRSRSGGSISLVGCLCGWLGPATELVVEASTSAASMCETIVKAIATKGDIAAEHIELVRHWPRGSVVGPSR